MLNFINIENGEVFSGVAPYIHWMDEGQSVNINYYKELVFTSDSSSVNVSIEDNPYFKLMDFRIRPNPDDPSQTIDPTQTENLNGFNYFNINNFLVNSLQLSGIPYNGIYLYRIFVYAFSSDVGQYTSEIYINGEQILIGADFYPENEILTDNLENLGIEIPMQIQKAIYESNVHEEQVDNILLNRKWKELLLEYWNIFANKGSYKSLINSMKFFEYQPEAIKIMEFWKEHYNKDIFISNNLEQILNDRFREQLSVLSKTTYIGLYLALKKIFKEEDKIGEYVPTEWDQSDHLNPNGTIIQDNPILNNIAFYWSTVDLSLKMTLVGNFFSTYFMPLHLDLIHSTIEDICFTNIIKIISGGGMQRRDFVDLSGNFISSVKKGSNYYIKPQNVFVTPRTILGYKEFERIGSTAFDTGGTLQMYRSQDESKYYDEVSILGVEDTSNMSYITGDYTGSSNTPWDFIFSGANTIYKFGALVPIDVKITHNVSSDDFIKASSIHWVRDHKLKFDYVDNGTYIKPTQIEGTTHYKYEFNFNLLFQNDGHYHFYITFQSAKGFEYSREFEVNILDDADNSIHIYKVERVNPNEYKDLTITTQEDGSVYIGGPEYSYELNSFMMSQVMKSLDYSSTQYICADIQNMQKNTGLNHVIMFVNQGNSSNSKVGDITANGATANSFSQYTDYWWFDRDIAVEMEPRDYSHDPYEDLNRTTGLLGEPKKVVIGIRKYFTLDSELSILYSKTFTKKNSHAVVEIKQVQDVIHVFVIYDDENPGYIKTYKLSDWIEFEVFGHKEKIRVYPDYGWYDIERDGDGKVLGLAESKLKCEGNFYRLVDEDRFIPMFHKLVKVKEENCEVLPSELMVAIPELKRTYTDYTDIVWEFLNSSTMESITTKPGIHSKVSDKYISHETLYTPIEYAESLIGKFEPRVLTPGYYNINLNYKYAGEQHKESRDAAFKIRKGYQS